LNALTPAFVEEGMRDLTDGGRAPSTVLHYLKFLRHVLNVAIRDGQLERNPFAQVRLPKVTAGRTRFLGSEEEAAIITALGPVHGPWARLAILTGLRRTEQFTLRWADVDLDRGLITLHVTKAGGVQYVHLNEEATTILRALDSWQRSVWVFPSENPKTPLDSRNFYRRVWIPTVKALGIEWVTWHDLRHTYASRLAMSGQAEGTIAALLRHSTTALVRRYAHLSPSHLREAVETVSAFGRKEEQPGSPPASQTPSEAPITGPTVTTTGNGDQEAVGQDA
jgi:integrase